MERKVFLQFPQNKVFVLETSGNVSHSTLDLKDQKEIWPTD